MEPADVNANRFAPMTAELASAGAPVRTYIRMLTMIDQIANASRAGKLAGGINTAIPITIATQPNHFGSCAPCRIARPLETPNTKAPATIGRKISWLRRLMV